MPRKKSTKAEPFLLVVVDEDRRKFTIEGPMLSAATWDRAIRKAQESGRDVRCFETNSGHDYVVTYQSRQGLTFVDPGGIIQPDEI